MPDVAKGKSTRHHADGNGNGLEAKGWRLPAHPTEQLVLKQVGAFLRDRGALLDALRSKRKSPDLVSAVLARAAKLADRCESGLLASYLEIVRALARRITVAHDQVTIEIDHDCLLKFLLDQDAASHARAKDPPPILIKVPVRFRRRGVEANLVVLDQQRPAGAPDANLVKALARAHGWLGRIVRGEASGIGDIARAEGLDRTYVTRLLCLAFLAPGIAKGILEGRQPTQLTAKRLISSALRIPLLWTEQHAPSLTD
jgi:hypothetical protein